MQIKKNKITIRHSFVPSTISNDSNTIFLQCFPLNRKKDYRVNCLIIDEEQGSKPALKDFLRHLSSISGNVLTKEPYQYVLVSML